MKFAFVVSLLLTISVAGAESAWMRIGHERPSENTAPPSTCEATDPELCPPPITSGFESTGSQGDE